MAVCNGFSCCGWWRYKHDVPASEFQRRRCLTRWRVVLVSKCPDRTENEKTRVRWRHESRDLMIEYHAFAIAEETSQWFVLIGEDTFGVQARIDLQDFSGHPSGRCLYLELRPAEVYKSVSTSRDATSCSMWARRSWWTSVSSRSRR